MATKTSELEGTALDWAVAIAMGWTDVQITDYQQDGVYEEPFFRPAKYFDGFHICSSGERFRPSSNWEQGGMLIDRIAGMHVKRWLQAKKEMKCEARINNMEGDWVAFGPTVLVAVMRCLVSYKLGDNVEVPAGLG